MFPINLGCFRPFTENLEEDSVVKMSIFLNSQNLLKEAHSGFEVGQKAKNTPSPSPFPNLRHQVKDQPPGHKEIQTEMG